MSFRVLDWAIQISLVCVSCGEETEYLDRRMSSGGEAYWLKSLGYYDVCEIRLVSDIDEINNAPLDSAILEHTSFPCFAWDNLFSIEDFKYTLENLPIVVLTLIKIEPNLTHKYGIAAEMIIAKLLREYHKDAFPFIHIGHSEICLLQAGENVDEILMTVRELRRFLNSQNVADKICQEMGMQSERMESVPSIQNTTSILLVSYPDQERFKRIVGEIHPTMLANCHPSFEKDISSHPIIGNPVARDSYGKDDLLFTWSENVPLGDLVKDVIEMRAEWGGNKKVLYKSHTHISSRMNNTSEFDSLSLEAPHVPEFKLFEDPDKLDLLNPFLRNLVIETASRFKGYLRLGYLQASFLDMINIFSYIEYIAAEIGSYGSNNVSVSWKKRARELQLLRLLDYCNHAIYQRYAGLESHLESASYLPFPHLCGVCRIINAASALPLYAMSQVKEGKNGWQVWMGFVCFGVNHAFQYDLAQVLSYPGEYLFRPVERWWVITHEISHIMYEMFDEDAIFKQKEREKIESTANRSKRNNKNQSLYDKKTLTEYAEEIFATWFDFRFMHKGQSREFLKLIWSSWIELSSVWDNKKEYLARSFIVYCFEEWDELWDLWNINAKTYRKKAEEYLNKMLDSLNKQVDGFQSYSNELTNIQKEAALLLITDFFMPLTFLYEKSDHDLIDLGERILRNDSNQQKYAQDIESGIILHEKDMDPIAISIDLSFRSLGRKVPLRETAAFILSMWHYYVTSERPRVGN